ncbi:MAG: zinc ribbon domain-containing protein [Butyrivibrio sp.]|nr:zinc ribbon domain-containing protein [Butyrivibrio sp.]
MKCPGCGKEITDSSQFCKYCGTKIEKKVTSSYQYHEPDNNNDDKRTPPTPVKKGVDKSFLAAVAIVAIVFVIIAIAISKANAPKYKCTVCGKTVKTAYYDPFDDDTIFCEDCAREYFAPFDYEMYKITDSHQVKKQSSTSPAPINTDSESSIPTSNDDSSDIQLPLQIHSYDDFENATVGSTVTVDAFVQDAFSWSSNGCSLYVASGNDAYYVSGLHCTESEFEQFKSPGMHVSITGTKVDKNGDYQINDCMFEIVDSSRYNLDPIDITNLISSSSISDYKNHRVCISEAIIKPNDYSNNPYYTADFNRSGGLVDTSNRIMGDDIGFKVQVGAREYSFIVDTAYTDSSSDPYKTVKEFKIEDKINCTGYLLFDQDNNPVVIIEELSVIIDPNKPWVMFEDKPFQDSTYFPSSPTKDALDNHGNPYNLMYACGAIYNWDADWKLGREYSSLSGYAGVPAGDNDTDVSGIIQIYGDGELLYELTGIDGNTETDHFSIDVTGVDVITIKAEGGCGPLAFCPVMIADVEVMR